MSATLPLKNLNKKTFQKPALSLLIICVLWIAAFNSLPFLLANLPVETWNLKHADLIVVLGASANKDGTPGSFMRERVLAGVKLFKDGLAPYIMFTGAAAHTKFVEAEVMADFAKANGVPADRIVLEEQAKNTAQNAFFSYQQMKEHGWHSVVTSPEHLLRSNVFFSHYPINYCMYPSGEPPELSLWERFNFDQREKQFVLNDLYSPKGNTLGLKPDQAALMPDIAKQTAALRSTSVSK